MSDANPNPENPYAAPQLAQAELAQVVDAAELGPGELPCHKCGQAVPAKAETCPRCGSRPMYDGLQLLVTAVLIFVIGMSVVMFVHFMNPDLEAIAAWIMFPLTFVIVIPAVNAVISKLKGGKW